MDEDGVLDRVSQYDEATQDHGARHSIDEHPARSPGLFSYFANVASPLTVGAARLLQVRPFSGRANPVAATSPEPPNGVNDKVAAVTIPDLQDGSNLRKARRVVACPNNSVEAVLSDGGAAESLQEPSIELGGEPPRPADSVGGGRPRPVEPTDSGIQPARPQFSSHEHARDPRLDRTTRPSTIVQPASQSTQNPYSKLMQAVRRGQSVGTGNTGPRLEGAAELQPFTAAAAPRFPPRPPAVSQSPLPQPRSHDCALVRFDGQDRLPKSEPRPQPRRSDTFNPMHTRQATHSTPPPLAAQDSATTPLRLPPVPEPTQAPPKRQSLGAIAMPSRPPATPPTPSMPWRRASQGAIAPDNRAVVPQSAPLLSPGPSPASGSVTWIPTYTRSLARRRASRVTFKPAVAPGRSAFASAVPSQRQSKRGRERDAENVSPSGGERAATRRRTMQDERLLAENKMIAQQILNVVNIISQNSDARPQYSGEMRPLRALPAPPTENPPGLTAQAWENSLSNVTLPNDRQGPLLSHLTPCASVQTELARREHEQRIRADRAIEGGTEAQAPADGFSFPPPQDVTELLGAQQAGDSAHEVQHALRATRDAFGMMAGPPRSAMPKKSFSEARQARRELETAAEKSRADAQPKAPAVPEFRPPKSLAADFEPALDKYVEERRKAGVAKSNNPFDLLGQEDDDEDPPSKAGAAAGPESGAAHVAPASAPGATFAAQPAKPLGAPPSSTGAAAAAPSESQAGTLAQPKPAAERPEDSRPAKKRPPVQSSWGADFLQQNKSDNSAAKEAIAKEIESRDSLATKPTGPAPSFGSDAPISFSTTSPLFQGQPAGASQPATSAPASFGFQPAAAAPSSAAASAPSFAGLSTSSALGPGASSSVSFGGSALFGATPAASSAAAAPTSAAAGLVMGGTNLFGGALAAPASSASAAPASSGISFDFKAPSKTSAAEGRDDQAPSAKRRAPGSSSDLFALGNASAVTTGMPAAAPAAASSAPSLFGSPLQAAPAASSSASPAAGLFGQQPASTAAAPSLFGAPAAQQQPASTAAASSLFGAPAAQQQPASTAAITFPFGTEPTTGSASALAGPASSSALFGSAADPTAIASQPAKKAAIKPIQFPSGGLGTATSSAAVSAPFSFNASAAAPAASSASPFGMPASSGVGFGQASAAPPILGGASGGSFLGLPSSTPASALFGNTGMQASLASSTPAFGATAVSSGAGGAGLFSSGLPGAGPAPGGSGVNPFGGGNAFGAPASSAAFGQSAPSFGSSAPTFGQSAPSFGQAPPAFGQSSPMGGATGNASFVFGANAASPSFGQQPAASSAAAFGSPSPAGGLFGNTAGGVAAPNPFQGQGQPAAGAFTFGAPGAQQPFSAPAANSMFGAPAASAPAGMQFGAPAAAPAFGAAAPTGAPFGAGQAQPTAQPFGAQPSMFNAGQAPAGPAGGQSMPAFMAGANPGAFNMGAADNRSGRKKIAVRRRRG